MQEESAPVSALSIAPQAFDEISSNVNRKARIEDIEYDLFNLVAFNPHISEDSPLIEQAHTGIHQIVEKIYSLPQEASNESLNLAVLPQKERTLIPRSKPLPQPKPETLWEKFAKTKGIQKKKKKGKVWDETHQEWRRSFGYKRANEGVLGDVIYEPKQGNVEDETGDPWSKAREDKIVRVNKNMVRQEKNYNRANGIMPKHLAQKSEPNLAGIPIDMNSGRDQGQPKRGQKNTRKALKMVQISTASMGKFDQQRRGEPAREKVATKSKSKHTNAFISSKDESQKALKVLNSVLINREKKSNKVEVDKQTKNNLIMYDAIEGDGNKVSGRKRKGRAGAGKLTKITKKRIK
mmetsp:Transcript_14235/g.20128  ORF Transcript_14235/g.20128 Transcript_14235/m.20128 type:complete len:350 (-) Transcript_14235:20-1069(-)